MNRLLEPAAAILCAALFLVAGCTAPPMWNARLVDPASFETPMWNDALGPHRPVDGALFVGFESTIEMFDPGGGLGAELCRGSESVRAAGVFLDLSEGSVWREPLPGGRARWPFVAVFASMPDAIAGPQPEGAPLRVRLLTLRKPFGNGYSSWNELSGASRE